MLFRRLRAKSASRFASVTNDKFSPIKLKEAVPDNTKATKFGLTVITGEALSVSPEFAGDVTAAMLVVCRSSEQKLIYKTCRFFQKKFYCIDHQHGRLVTWLQAKNFAMKPVFFVFKCKVFRYFI